MLRRGHMHTRSYRNSCSAATSRYSGSGRWRLGSPKYPTPTCFGLFCRNALVAGGLTAVTLGQTSILRSTGRNGRRLRFSRRKRARSNSKARLSACVPRSSIAPSCAWRSDDSMFDGRPREPAFPRDGRRLEAGLLGGRDQPLLSRCHGAGPIGRSTLRFQPF